MSCVPNALATPQRSGNAVATRQRLGRRRLNAFATQERLVRMLSAVVLVLPRGRATFAVLRLRRIPSNTQKLSQLNCSYSLAGQNLRA